MQDFETRQDLFPEEWNKPYVASTYFADYDEDEGLIRSFMINRNEPEALQPQADKVDAFCGKSGLTDCPENHEVILLDDRVCEPGYGKSRPDLGPLTPSRALEALRKPVSLLKWDLLN